MRIAVLGCGRIGSMHADNIHAHPRAELAAIYDTYSAASAAVSSRTGAQIMQSAEEIFASKNIDAVLIATATATHADLLEQAIAAGKPVLCEKPIDLSLARVNECATNIAKSNIPIQLGFVRRFDPTHRATVDAIRSGEIGELMQVVITSRDPEMPPSDYSRVSGGIFRDMTIHDFDMARFLLGENPVSVFATGSRLIDPDLMNEINDYDTITVVMTTASGKQCIINNSRQAVYGYDQRVEALGTKGMVTSNNRKINNSSLNLSNFTEQSAPLQNFFIDRYHEAFNLEIDAFIDAITNNTPPEVGFEDGRQALILAEAAIKSIAEDRTVQVSEIG